MSDPIRLDLGAGAVSPPGFLPIGNGHDRKQIYPLPFENGSIDEIRASHVLEHFPHGQVLEVLRDWVRTLRPGGKLRIAVPDFEKIAEGYLAGDVQPTEGFVMGGQVDGADYHRAIFDERKLKKALSDAGLVLLRPWISELEDGAALPVSLNLEGLKPFISELRVQAAMSVPRLGFMDNFYCAMQAFPRLGIPLKKFGGAFWGQAMTRCFERIIEEGVDAIVTLDYDSVFTPQHAAMLVQLAMVHPEADAIAPIQSSRHLPQALFTIRSQATGKYEERVNLGTMQGELRPVTTAHFGLTLIRVEQLLKLERPWFHSIPGKDGRWEDGRVDEDVAFWHKWQKAGNTLFLANRIAIGHAELMVRWPGRDLQVTFQSMQEFNEKGPPDDVWR